LIFVTVGTHTEGFNRLLKEVDNLVGTEKIKEKVVMQIGNSTYKPRNAVWFRFVDLEKLSVLYKKSRIVITHGGAGSILNGLSNNKTVIVVPRLKKYNEVTNDHQLDLVKKLEMENKIIAVYSVKDLRDAIKKTWKIKKLNNTKNEICKEIERFLSKMS